MGITKDRACDAVRKAEITAEEMAALLYFIDSLPNGDNLLTTSSLKHADDNHFIVLYLRQALQKSATTTAAGVAGGGVPAETALEQRDATDDPSRVAVLKDLKKLALTVLEVDLEQFINGEEELLLLELGELNAMIPAGLRTDIYFREIYAGVLATLRDRNYQEAVIFTGTPGVGKSAAALLIACDLASRQLHFMHRSTTVDRGEVFVYMDFRQPDNPRVNYSYEKDRVNHDKLSAHLGDPSVLLIWDGKMPGGQYQGERAYIVLSSPNEQNFHDFAKGGVPTYFMDTWTLLEILKALPLYPGIAQEVAVERFRQFGGTVRDVLANAHVEDHTFKVKVEQTVGGADLAQLCTLTYQGTSSDLMHRFAHIRADPYMRFSKLVLASPAVRQLVFQKHVDLLKRTVRATVLSAAAGERAHAAFRGMMLEELGHEKLPTAVMVTIQHAKWPTSKEKIAAASAAAAAAHEPAHAGIALRAADAMQQRNSAASGIIGLRRSKRLRAAAADSNPMLQEADQLMEEMAEEIVDHHSMPPPDFELAAAPAAAEDAQQLLAGMQLGSGEQRVQLEAVERVWDSPGLEIGKKSAFYLQPTTANNAAWDAVRKCAQHFWILQYTISGWHGIKAQSVLDLLARFNPEDQQRAVFVFVVPPDTFRGYLRQPWLSVGKKLMVDVPKQLLSMPQMVLEMPLDSRGSSEGGTP